MMIAQWLIEGNESSLDWSSYGKEEDWKGKEEGDSTEEYRILNALVIHIIIINQFKGSMAYLTVQLSTETFRNFFSQSSNLYDWLSFLSVVSPLAEVMFVDVLVCLDDLFLDHENGMRSLKG